MTISLICVLFLSPLTLPAQDHSVPVIRQPHPVTCLPASSTAVMQYWGSGFSYGEVSTKPDIGSGGVTYFEMQEWIGAMGFETLVCSLRTAQLPTLLALGIPPMVAVVQNSKHTIVCTGYDKEDSIFTVMDPLQGDRSLSFDALERLQQNAAFQAMLIFPDTTDHFRLLASAGLPVKQWHDRNARYRSETLLQKGLAAKDSVQSLAFFARACQEDPGYPETCYHYASSLYDQGREQVAWEVVRKILLRDPNFEKAERLKRQIEGQSR